MRLVRLAPIGALALTMAACGTLRPASVGGGECRVFERPEYAVLGQTRYDQNWIDSNTEAGVAACGWQRPKPRPQALGRPAGAKHHGAREKEAAGPDRPHQASRCAERQCSIFGTGGDTNAGAAIGSCRAGNSRAILSTNCSSPTDAPPAKPRRRPAGGVEARSHEALMTNEELLRERVAKLEVQMTHLSEKLDDTHKKVEEMHAILLQAKGARWVIVGLAGVAGLASGLVAKLVP